MTVKFPRDLLLKLKWTGKGLDNVTIYMVSRGTKEGIGIVQGKDIEHLGRSFMDLVDGTSIPYHRIRSIMYDGSRTWKRP